MLCSDFCKFKIENAFTCDAMAASTAFPLPEVNTGILSVMVPDLFEDRRDDRQPLPNNIQE